MSSKLAVNDTAEVIREYAWEACAIYFLRCGGSIPEEPLKIIRRILKNTTASRENIRTALHRVSSDVQTILFLLEESETQNERLAFSAQKTEAIFSFYRDSSALP